jgi:hypothetical protein
MRDFQRFMEVESALLPLIYPVHHHLIISYRFIVIVSVGSGTTLQAGRSRVPFPMWSLDFSIDLILPAVI